MSFAENMKKRMEAIQDKLNHIIVPDVVYEHRINICLDCPRLFSATMQCKECGCFLKAKAQLESAACPLEKW